MQEIIQFLLDSKVFYLATADGDQPRVRPMGFVMEYEGKLAMCTNNKKEMYRQMKANPKVEISACGSEGRTLRITGEVAFNPSREVKAKALEVNPRLKGMYSPDDGIFEIFYFTQGTAVFGDMKGGKKEINL
jgi:uncharacterized pyridoxamine 5'-phosphate oxidase family protein